MSRNAPIITEQQAQSIAEIITQYAPEGWTRINLEFYRSDDFTRITSWAQTSFIKSHGFQLDEMDANMIESIYTELFERYGGGKNTAVFSLNAGGYYSLELR